MQVHVPLLAVVVILVASTESKPTWSNLYTNHYSPVSDAETITNFKLQQTPVLHYSQESYSPYYFYNVHTELNNVPATVISHEKQAISHIPSYSFYYGPAVYDFRFPLSPIIPTWTHKFKPTDKPSDKPIDKPSDTPIDKPIDKPTDKPSAAPQPPTAGKEDGIEKLDNKVDPAKEIKKPILMEQAGDDDSVVIESI